MRDEHDARGQPAEEPLQPLEAGEVEVVRRLVEQEDVEAREQDRRERRTGRLAAREVATSRSERRPRPTSESTAPTRASKSSPPSARKRSSASEYAPASLGSVPSRAASASISSSAAPTPVRRAR
jgi:hypothetical protein